MATRLLLKNLLFIALLTSYYLVVASATSIKAQTVTGVLAGNVIDNQQQPLEGVLVQIKELSSGFNYAKTTDKAGNYRIDLLLAGDYQITASKSGYQTTIIEHFLIEVNREKIIKPPPIQLTPEQIAVTSPPTATTSNQAILQVDIADATLRGSATNLNFPLAGIRSFDSLALLVPGVFPAPTTTGLSGPGLGTGVGTAGEFSVNGQRARANNFTIDGSDNNDQEVGVRRQGFIAPTSQTIESIKEFQITTLLADAEAGRNTGAQVNVVTQSGSNQLHLSLQDFFTYSALNARDYFDLSGKDNPKKNYFARHQYSGVTSLPLKKDKLNLFIALAGLIVDRSAESHFSVPTPSQRQQALRQAGANQSRLGVDILTSSFYPLPNNPGGPYGNNTLTQLLNAQGRGIVGTIKVEQQLSLFNRPTTLTYRYNFTEDRATLPAVDAAINASIESRTRTQNFALAVNSSLSSTTANQIRFSYGRTALNFAPLATSPLIFQSTPIKDRTGDGIADGRTGPIGRILFQPFSSIGVDPALFPQGRANNTFQIADTLVFSSRYGTTKLGFDIRRVQSNSFLDRNYRAQVAFTTGLISNIKGMSKQTSVGTGVDFAAFGLPTDIQQTLAQEPNSHLGLRSTEFSGFIQQQYSLHPHVLLSVGLRYEQNTVPQDVNRRIENTLTAGLAELPPFDANRPFSQRFLAAFGAQQAFLGGRKQLYNSGQRDFAPRLSLAWDIFGNGRTALRLGYGLYYDAILGTVVSQSRNGFPNFIPVDFGASAPFPQILAANPAFIFAGRNQNQPIIQPGTLNTIGLNSQNLVEGIGRLLAINGFFVGAGFGTSITLPSKDLSTPYSQQFSISLEKSLKDRYLISLAYAGSTSHKLLRRRTPNGGPFSSINIVTFANNPVLVTPLLKRPQPALGALTIFDSSANSNYHSLQASFATHLTTNYQLQISYTYSHAIDDVSDLFDLAGSMTLAQDETGQHGGLRLERASANFDVRQRLVLAGSYQLPQQAKLFKNIELTSIITLQTGQPFTVNTNLDLNFDGNLTDRLSTTQGLQIVNQGTSQLKLAPGVTTLQLTGIPSLTQPITGIVGRNSFRARGIASVDLALSREFTILAQQKLQLRLEAFNLFNRSHLGIPVRILEAPAFGQAVNTLLPARQLQIALQYQF